MTLAFLVFWILMVLGFFGYTYIYRADYSTLGAGFPIWLLIFLLGIKVYPIPIS